MTHFLQQFQNSLVSMEKSVLFFLGIPTLIAGLYVWLAGRCFAGLVSAIIASLITAFLVFKIAEKNFIVTVIASAIIFCITKFLADGRRSLLPSASIAALLGAFIVFLGMVLLLISKGADPVNAIIERKVFFTTLYFSMAGFGAVVQMFLCGKIPKTEKNKTEKNKGKN